MTTAYEALLKAREECIVTCPNCEGAGTLRMSSKTILRIVRVTSILVCPLCGGAGFVYKSSNN
jgi:DnaJ-class molecular chaperone